MASVSAKVPAPQSDKAKAPPLKKKLPSKKEEVKQVETPPPPKPVEEKTEEVKQPETPQPSKLDEEVKETETPQPSKPDEEKPAETPQSTKSDEEVKETEPLQSEKVDEEKKEQVEEEKIQPEVESQSNNPPLQEEQLTCVSSEEIPKKKVERKSDEQLSKPRSVNFASTVDDAEVSKTHSSNTLSKYSSSSTKSSRRPVDFIDTLVESYKLETSNTGSLNKEEKKYVPKTNRSRLNPNWREHRTRRLMNKLEELSLWDREEELKAAQAQSLREQKWEQIQDRQRNHDLCLNLMRQRHESEMESAVLLDRAAAGVNDENTKATIARAMNLSSPAELLAYDLPTPPHSLKRRAKQEQENPSELKTPIGRYRQFETNMEKKVEKINQKLQPDHEIMRAYSPYRTSIPTSAVPLFSETYSALLSVPDSHSSNKYNQYHYGVASYLHQPQHAPSPDYETRRSYSNRDVRVPLKEQANDYSHYDNDSTDEYTRSNPIENDYYAKYRSRPIDDDYYPKHRSTHIDDDYYPKQRSTHIDDDYYPKHRSTHIDDDYYPKHRLTQIDDDYYPKSRSTQIDDDSYSKYRSNPVDDDYLTRYRSTLASSQLDYSPPRRTTSLASPTASSLYDYTTVANTPREYSFIHSRQPASTSIHLRSLNDDLNAITSFSTETSKKILHSIGDSPNNLSTKTRSSSGISTSKHIGFHDDDDDENLNYNNNSSRNYSSKTMYQPVEILSLSSTR